MALVAAPLGWAISDRLESDNDFCISCHLDGRPLHEQKMRQFASTPPVSLAAAHAAASPGFRCIDCHGGTSIVGRVRVKAVAARDALRYLLADFGEPETMRHPLWDEDCSGCHPSYEPERDDDFHAIPDHNTALPHACVECHTAHPTGRAELHYQSREVVLPICRNCHEEF
jgi:nitrate/TMAO reductase-like tetraheme cytochrome c subunit